MVLFAALFWFFLFASDHNTHECGSDGTELLHSKRAVSHMLKPAWVLQCRGSKGSSKDEGVLLANEKKLGSGKLSRQPPVNDDRQHWENGRRISTPHHVPFRRTKPCAHQESASSSKTSTHLNTCSLKHTSFLASQKQQRWEGIEEVENRIWMLFQCALLRFDRHCADVQDSQKVIVWEGCLWLNGLWNWLAAISQKESPWEYEGHDGCAKVYWWDMTPLFEDCSTKRIAGNVPTTSALSNMVITTINWQHASLQETKMKLHHHNRSG